MKVSIVDGRMAFDVAALLDAVSDEDKLSFIDSLACQDVVIDFVMQQVTEGWTEMGSHGGMAFHATAEPFTGIDKARRAIAKASDEIARKEIERLEKELVAVNKERQDLADRLHENRTRMYG